MTTHATIDRLFIYPIKGCRGFLTPAGLRSLYPVVRWIAQWSPVVPTHDDVVSGGGSHTPGGVQEEPPNGLLSACLRLQASAPKACGRDGGGHLPPPGSGIPGSSVPGPAPMPRRGPAFVRPP